MNVICVILSFFIICLGGCNLDKSGIGLDAKSEMNFTDIDISDKPVERNNTIKINDIGKTIATRFSPPEGFERTQLKPNSFGTYLRNLPLKPLGSLVKKYDQSIKQNRDVYDAVVDLPIGNKNLHQCADAIIRLRAEYFWHQEKYNEIRFNLTNGQAVAYEKWKDGNRLKVTGNQTKWVKTSKPSNSYEEFWNYLELVFMYAGTLSLSKELTSKTIANINIGDVFIVGGSPGHAVIVVDLAVNANTSEKMFLLAQSYMPAQDIQVLKNPMVPDISPWYHIPNSSKLHTPEWTFNVTDLKSF